MIFLTLEYILIHISFSIVSIIITIPNEARGSYWSWDPKETWAFITWILFAIHILTNIKWKGTNFAIVASVGFLIIWIYYVWSQSIRNRAP